MASKLLFRCLQQIHKTSRHLHQTCSCSASHHISRRLLSTPSKWHGLWEPNDLKLEPDIPEYEIINIKMQGFDFPVLESYAKHVHNAMDSIFDLDTDAYPFPGKSMEIRTFLPNSETVGEKYNLVKYERTVTVENVPTTTVPILLQYVQRHCPVGVEVTVMEPNPDEEERRFVPDYDVLELQLQKEAIESGQKKKKKK